MTLDIPEVKALADEISRLRKEFNHLIATSVSIKKTITPSEIARLEGVSVSQIRKNGKERYLLPRFGQSGYPTGATRWDVEEYLKWRAIDPMERYEAYLQSLRETTKRRKMA